MRAKPRHDRHAREARAIEHIRERISSEAARLMVQEGVGDYHLAKRKAALRLNLPQDKHLPSNQEIEAALRRYLELFDGRHLGERLRRLRAIALEAMRFLARFHPRLVGPVLSGTVTPASEIQFHVSAETLEEIGLWLQEHRIPYEQAERRVRFGGDRYETLPAFRFTADGVAVELCLFTPVSARELPLSPVDGKPMRRANLKELEALLREGG